MDPEVSVCNPMDLEHMLIDERAAPRYLRISLLESITNNFSNDLVIGSGGFSVVYKGILQNGTVAVKKLKLTQTSVDVHETKFQQEVDSLMSVKHKYIVRFLGYCSDTQGKVWKLNGKNVMAEERQRFLCFEYLPWSLDKYIKDSSQGHDWRTSYQIIKGICEGLYYLHQQNIVHLDLKPANILLDDYMMPKIADFGLSKCFDENQTRDMTSNPFGTQGYMAPESYGGLITFKSDIYSLGIIIIEILTGNKGYPDIDNVFENWSIKFETSTGDTKLEPVRVCAEIGIECIDSNPAKRPNTRQILERLDEMESICGVSENIADEVQPLLADEVQPLLVSEGPSQQQRITNKALMGLGVTSIEILDVHPLELRFPLEPNQDTIIPVTLTNRTHHHVGVWITPASEHTWMDYCHPVSVPDDPRSSLFRIMEPHSTDAIPMTTSRSLWRKNNYPPVRDTGTFEVVMVVMGSMTNYESLLQRYTGGIGSRLNMDVDHLTRIEALGGEVHRAMLKATICDPASCEAAVTQTFIPALPSGFHEAVYGIDVHPTEPWFLVNIANDSGKSHVLILNYLTQETLEASLYFISPKIHAAKFIPQKQWFATGDGAGFVTIYAYSTKDEVIKTFRAHQRKKSMSPVCMLAVHPTYPFLLTSCSDDIWIRLWDWDQGWKCTRILGQNEDPYSIIWNQLDTDTFACASANCVEVWELGLSEEGWETKTLRARKSLKMVNSKDCCFGGDSHPNSLITCGTWDYSDRSCARIWDRETEESVHTLFVGSDEDIFGVACHPTLPILATSYLESRTVCLWDARTFRIDKMFQLADTPIQGGMVFIGTNKDLPRLVVGCDKGVAIMEINLSTFFSTDDEMTNDES